MCVVFNENKKGEKNQMNEIELKKEIQDGALKIAQMRVKNDMDLRSLNELISGVKQKIKQVKAWFAPLKESAKKTHKQLCDKENEFLEPLENIEEQGKVKSLEYTEEQKRVAEIERRRAEAEAKAKEDEKKRKIQEKIDEENRKIREEEERERKRQEEELARIKAIENEEDRKKAVAEEQERSRREEEKLKEEARKAEEKKLDLEQKKEDVYVVPKQVEPATEVKGVSVRYSWEPRVIDKALVPDRYKVVDLAMLKKIGTATKGEEIVAGVEWMKQATQSNRS